MPFGGQLPIAVDRVLDSKIRGTGERRRPVSVRLVTVSNPRVTLVTSSDLPDLAEDFADLPEALRNRHLDVQVAVWDDPLVDWDDAGLCIVLTITDFADRPDEFFAWASSVPRLLNDPQVLKWNSDKHYLQELEARGMPTIQTTWLEPEQNLSKHQVHTRMPAGGDFVVKSALSSNRHTTGRYTATDARSRSDAILHAVDILESGRAALVQRYLQSVDSRGEISLVYFNGLLTYAVAKDPQLQNRTDLKLAPRDRASIHPVTTDERFLGEDVRHALHGAIADLTGRDHLLLYCRIDIIRTEAGFKVLEVNLMDVTLYISAHPKALESFANAVQVRAYG